MDRQNIPTQRHPHPSSLHRFARDEDGSMIVFGLILFTIMLMIGGLAVDLMRFESTRTALQQSTDRCVLAAASFTQALEPEDVVNDCMEKADKAEYLTGIVVDEGLNYREVTATATAATNPLFMHLMGIDELDAPAASKAEQRITNVEIAMVLDVSGSMENVPSRITNLKGAASDFVDKLLKNDVNHRISISIVPYNGQVNLGPTLAGKYNTINPNGQSSMYCADLPAAGYQSTSIEPTAPLSLTAYADTRSATSKETSYVSYNGDYGKLNPDNLWCPASTKNIVRPPNNNLTTLKSQINALDPIGATSINAGMKWGIAMVDPASRSMFSKLVTSSVIPSYFAGRPFDYDDEDVMKVIVLMTDGAQWPDHRLNEKYKSGDSGIYLSKGDGNLSIYHPSKENTGKPYWVPNRSGGEWRNEPWDSGRGVSQLKWPEVWAKARVSWVAWQLYARALGSTNSTRENTYNTMMAAFRTVTGTERNPSDYNETPEMDSQLQTVCSAARAKNVVIFGIALEAPPGGKAQIRGCAGFDSHYFDVDAPQLKTAFNTIASQISYLRLTQ